MPKGFLLTTYFSHLSQIDLYEDNLASLDMERCFHALSTNKIKHHLLSCT